MVLSIPAITNSSKALLEIAIDSSLLFPWQINFAKLICHGNNREESIAISKRALDEFVIAGIESTIGLHKKILQHDDFVNSKFDTNWLAKSDILN